MEENHQVSDSGGASPEAGALGLDIGTSRIVLAGGPHANTPQSQLNAFVSVPYARMTENILQQNQTIYQRNGKELYIYGNDSERFASFFNTVPRRPMQHGVLNAHEAMGQQIIEAIIERLLPRTRRQELVCFSIPGKGEGADANLVYHEAVLRNFIQGLGYRAKAINEGLAVIFSELQQENFTGIGISFGGGMCNVCVAFLSVPMLTFSLPKAGDYIDQSVSEVTAEPVTRVRLLKEESLDLARQPADKVSSALHIYYDEVIQNLIARLHDEFVGSHHLPHLERPLPIVLSGGTAKPHGFRQKFESLLKASDFPTPISEVRLASDPLTATARGCHIAALSEMR